MNLWFSRDPKDGDEPSVVFVHTSKPELIGGTWVSEGLCWPLHDIKHGKCEKLSIKDER